MDHSSSMPLLSLPHDAFFQIPNKVSIVPWPAALPTCSSAASSSCTARVSIGSSLGRWGIICRAWLKADRCVWIEVTCHSLNRNRNAALLYFHGRSPLPARSHRCLSVQILLLRRSWPVLPLRQLGWLLLHHAHLVIRARLL